jgi:hypothetical protein
MYLKLVFAPSFCVTSVILAISDETLGSESRLQWNSKEIRQLQLLHISNFPLVAPFMLTMK